MNDAAREMNLREYMEQLPPSHGAYHAYRALLDEVKKFRQAATDEAELIGCCEQCGAGCVLDVDHCAVSDDALTFCDECYRGLTEDGPHDQESEA